MIFTIITQINSQEYFRITHSPQKSETILEIIKKFEMVQQAMTSNYSYTHLLAKIGLTLTIKRAIYQQNEINILQEMPVIDIGQKAINADFYSSSQVWVQYLSRLVQLSLGLQAEKILNLFLGDCDDSGESKFRWLPNLVTSFYKVSFVSIVAIVLFFCTYFNIGSKLFASYLILIPLLTSLTSLTPLINLLCCERVSRV